MAWGVLDQKPVEATKDYLKWSGELFQQPAKKQKNTVSKDVTVTSQERHSRRPKDVTHPPSDVLETSYAGHEISAPKTSYLDNHIPTAERASNAAPPQPPSSKGRIADEPKCMNGHDVGRPLIDDLSIPTFLRRE